LYKSYKGIEGNIGQTKSALPLLCNRGRRFIAGASYKDLEIRIGPEFGLKMAK
jgi:hypothetical protein